MSSILETFDPIFMKIAKDRKDDKKNARKNQKRTREQTARNDALQRAQGRSLLGGGTSFTGRPGAVGSLLGGG